MSFSFSAMWQYKCPRCRKGDLFNKPFQINKPLEMPHSCAYCGQRMEPEPGYYYGAMFLSYIVLSLLLLPPILLLVFMFDWSVNAAIFLSIAICVLFFFRILRGARSLWIHMMVRYNPNAESEYKSKMAQK